MRNFSAEYIIEPSRDEQFIYFNPPRGQAINEMAISIFSIKNPVVSMDLTRMQKYFDSRGYGVVGGTWTGRLRIVLGANIENRITNSLDTINAVGTQSPPFSSGSPIRITVPTAPGRLKPPGSGGGHYFASGLLLPGGGTSFRTDVRDLSYYFAEINIETHTISLGRNIRGNDFIFKTTSLNRTGSFYGRIAFTCFQSNPNEVTLAFKAGTQYLSLPYKFLIHKDTGNLLASKESHGRFGFVSYARSTGPFTYPQVGGSQTINALLYGPIARASNLIVGTRSRSDEYTVCSSEGDTYSWTAGNTGDTGNPPPPVVDPNPPQVGATTTISTIGGVTLSYDNAGEYKDLLRFNSALIRTLKIENRLYKHPYVNRLDLARLGWGLVGAASDTRITARALKTGGNTDHPRTLILKKIDNNFIGFLRLYQYGLLTSQQNIQIPAMPLTTLLTLASTDGYFDPNSQAVKNIETILNFDINGDGSVGNLAPPAPPAPGTINISTVRNVVLSYDTTGVEKDLLKVNGSLIKDQNNNNINYNQYANNSYEAIAAGTVNNENFLVWKTPENGAVFVKGSIQVNPSQTTLVIWKMSSLWKLISTTPHAIHPLNSPGYYQTETDFAIDFNADGKIGNPNTPPQDPNLGLSVIENTGNILLSYDQNDSLRANGILIKLRGVPIQRTNPRIEFQAAENVNNINSLLLKMNENGFSYIWRFDADWSFLSSDTGARPGSDAFYNNETLFNIDIDKDGIIGRQMPPISIPTQPGLNLTLSYDRQGIHNNLLKINGALVKDYANNNVNVADYLGAKWQIVSAGIVDNKNTLLWKNTDNGYLHFWRLSESWTQTTSDGWFAPGSPPFYAIETLFNLDLNNDGRIGSPFTAPPNPPTPPSSTIIESLGNVTLAYNQNNDLTANGNFVKFNNISIKRAPNDWAFLAAENINGINTLLAQWKESGYLHFMQFDNNWNNTGGTGWYAPNSADFFAVERLFGVDLNQDGTIGSSIRLTSNSTTLTEALSNSTLTPRINLTSNLSLDPNVGVSYLWQYNLGSGWLDWTLSQTNSRINSSIDVVFLPSYTTLKIRCEITIILPNNSLAFSVFGGNLEMMSDEFTINKKTETNYVAVRSPVPVTFTYNRGSSFNLDDLPKYIQDSIGAISGGDLGPDYITGIPSSWTPLCSPFEQDKCNTYQQAKNGGVYGTRLLKVGQTYTIYPRAISFRPFIIDFENI